MMKKKLLIFTLFSVFLETGFYAQTVQDTTYYKSLYYTGKVWGFIKYFHSAFESSDNNWDSELIATLTDIKTDVSNQNFNNYISSLIDKIGPMAEPEAGSNLPEIPDSLRFNLDLTWQDDAVFTNSVTAKLDTIRVRFRPHRNYFVDEAWEGGNPIFNTDNQFYEWGVNLYPDEEYRLLALFRYWNIINYFYPYKNIIDQNWDSTLVEFIPKIINCEDAISFHRVFSELATRLNDSHAIIFSSIINEDIVGYYYLPLTLKYIEDETVITGVYTDNSSIQVGDVIKSINGSDIYSIRDNLRKYIAGSNDPVIERNINKRILAGPLGEVKLVLEDAEGQKIVTLTRNIYISDYYDLIESTEPIWKIIESDSGKFGYVDMGRLEVHHINNMFSALWETDGIIFDIRNYPQGTMWKMVNYLFDGPIHIANFTTPDITYPGTLFWHFEHVGWGDFSQTYNKPIFILFDETTQSQAEYTVMAFEQHPQAHKIGSQTSGADGNVTSIKLPGGIITYFTALGTFYPDFTNTQRIGIIPDVEVHPTIAGVREGRDEVLEVALQYNIINSVEDNISNQIHISNLYLHQNYPNPFNSSTSIEFTLPKPEYVKLKVYNILGKEVATLVAKKLNQGNHTYQFDGSNLASGVYYYQLEAGDFMEVKKMILLK